MNDHVIEVDASVVWLLIAAIVVTMFNILTGLHSLYERIALRKKEQELEKMQKSDNLNMDEEKEQLVDWKLINMPGIGAKEKFVVCSACGMGVEVTKYTIQEVKEVFNFCPCCGRRMKLDVEFGRCGICKHLAKCWKERIARDGGRYCQQYEEIDSEEKK